MVLEGTDLCSQEYPVTQGRSTRNKNLKHISLFCNTLPLSEAAEASRGGGPRPEPAKYISYQVTFILAQCAGTLPGGATAPHTPGRQVAAATHPIATARPAPPHVYGRRKADICCG